jgi:hypothetical protein
VRRISAGEKSSGFVNSHFYYVDMEEISIESYNYTLLGEEQVAGVVCYKIKSEKKTKDDVYSHGELFISKKDYTLKQAYFFENGKHTKTLLVERIDWMTGVPVVRKMVMSRTDGTGRSLLYTKKAQLNINLSDSLFQSSNL